MVHSACGLAQIGLVTAPIPNASIARTGYPRGVDQKKVQL